MAERQMDIVEPPMPAAGAKFERIEARNAVAGTQVYGGVINYNFHGGKIEAVTQDQANKA